MNTNKKNGFLKVAGSMMAVTMLATCVVAGTMAKYTSSKPGIAAKAQVAKWSITVDETELKSLTMAELPFTIYDTDTATSPDYEEKHVTENMIAPGTWGYATIEIKNAGQVNADITADFTKTVSGLPTGMKVTVLDEDPGTTSVPEITTETAKVTVADVKPEGVATIAVAFVWDFDDEGKGTYDGEDTELGEKAEKLTLGNLAITATQVD